MSKINKMEQENLLSGYKYQISPKYNNFEFKGLRTPQVIFKNETSEILNQTKESLHNLLLNIKNSSIIKENSENKNINVMPKFSGLSSTSNSKIPEEIQNSYESYSQNKLSQLSDSFNRNIDPNLLNYKKIPKTNYNAYNLGNNSMKKNLVKFKLNKQIEPYGQINDKMNSENDLNLYLNNNIYNTINTNNRITNYSKVNNSVSRKKYNSSMSKNKNIAGKNKKIISNLIEKIKLLKSAISQNKKDITNLIQIYNDAQKQLLEQIDLIDKNNKELIKEKDIKIKDLEQKVEELKNDKKEKENIIIKSKQLKKEIENLNNEIKKLNKNNQDLQKSIKNKDITLEKCNEEIKNLEEKLKKFSDKDFINYELKEKEDELNKSNNNSNNKIKSYQILLLEYKKKNDELLKENKNISGQNLILTSQKKSLTKENMNYKQMIDEFKINNEKLTKERDEYKIKKEKLINEIEIIKLNNDKIYNIKTVTNNNTNKLKNEINSLKKEKEILDEQNQALQKRIKSLDKKNLRNKSMNAKSKTCTNLKSDKLKKFINLKIIKNKEFIFSLNTNNKNNIKNSNKKNTPKKTTKKIYNKFKKISISNKVVDIFINKKSGNSNKKPIKKINKFKKVVKCSKIVDIFIKNIPKPAPKPKKKKFLKLKAINEVANICLKSKINNKKFKSKLLKISSKTNNLNINPVKLTAKKKPELIVSNPEFFIIEKTKSKPVPIKQDTLIKEEEKTNEKINNIVYAINKLENIELKAKAKALIYDIKCIESFSLDEKHISKEKNKDFMVEKIENINVFNKSKDKEKKEINVYKIDNNNYFNLLAKANPIKAYEITKNNFISFEPLQKSFILLEKSDNDNSFYLMAKQNKKNINYEIYKNNEITLEQINKKFAFKIANNQNLILRAGPKNNKILLKKVTTMSMILRPNKKILLSRTFNENTNQNKSKLSSFFSNFLKGKKTNTFPIRVLTVEYKKNPKGKILEINKKNSISPQNKFNFTPKDNKNKKNIYSINNSISLNYEKQIKKIEYNIININSFSYKQSKKPFNLTSLPNPDSLTCDEDTKQLITELNLAISLKNDEIKRLEKEKSDSDLANQLFNDSSTEQIEALSNSLSLFKEKSEKLSEEIEDLKGELNNNKNTFEEKKKEYEENKSNLNKTIEQLTKENSQLKLDLFKRGTDSEKNKSTENQNNNSEEQKDNNEKNDNKIKELEKQIETLKEDMNKLRQSKIIETNQLKLEVTKSKVEVKRLTNQIKKLESEKAEPKKEGEDNLPTLKINDIKGNSDNKDEIGKLKNEIENYKNKISEMNIEVKKNEELRHQNIMYTNKLMEVQKKCALANQVISKAKKYNLCVAYMTELLKDMKPENEKQNYLINKLKVFTDEYKKEKENKKNE